MSSISYKQWKFSIWNSLGIDGSSSSIVPLQCKHLQCAHGLHHVMCASISMSWGCCACVCMWLSLIRIHCSHPPMKFASFALSVYGSWQVIFHGEVAKHFLSSGTFYYINRSNVSSSCVHFSTATFVHSPFHFDAQLRHMSKRLFLLFLLLLFIAITVSDAGNSNRPFRPMDVANKIFTGTWFGYLRVPSQYRAENVNGVSSECRGWVVKSFSFIRSLDLISVRLFNALILMDLFVCETISLNASIILLNWGQLRQKHYQLNDSISGNVENLPRIVGQQFGHFRDFFFHHFVRSWCGNIDGNLLCGECQ